jgi:WD repeat-containing protein 19
VTDETLTLGDLKTGLDLCRKLKHKSLQKECAEILEQMKQLTEAAALYEAAGFYDKAAQLNIKLKNWQKIGQLLPHISSPKVNPRSFNVWDPLWLGRKV